MSLSLKSPIWNFKESEIYYCIKELLPAEKSRKTFVIINLL